MLESRLCLCLFPDVVIGAVALRLCSTNETQCPSEGDPPPQADLAPHLGVPQVHLLASNRTKQPLKLDRNTWLDSSCGLGGERRGWLSVLSSVYLLLKSLESSEARTCKSHHVLFATCNTSVRSSSSVWMS